MRYDVVVKKNEDGEKMYKRKTKSNSVTTGFIWRFLERCGASGVAFVVSIILARLLEPELYGLVALVAIFTSILEVFVDSGFGAALVQKKDADELDFSSVFYFSIFTCIILYIILFIISPYIASYFGEEKISVLIRVLGLGLIISGIKNVQQAYVSKKMIFQHFFYATLVGTVTAAIVGITMAYLGFGVWALVAQNLVNKSIDTIILWITVDWRPQKVFSWKRLKSLFSFGWKILATAMIDKIYNRLREIIISKQYSASDLAFYNKGDQFPSLLSDNINSSIDSVLLPALSSHQDDVIRLKELTRKSMRIGSYLMFPIMTGLAVCAKSIVLIILGEKWLPCAIYLQLFCFVYAVRPLNTANMNSIKAIGRSDIVLKVDMIKKTIGILMIIITMKISPIALTVGLCLTHAISVAINGFTNKKVIGYRIREQIEDAFIPLLSSCVMGLLVYIISFLNIHIILSLGLQIISGFVVYVILSIVLRAPGYYFVLQKIKTFKRRLMNCK